MQPTVNILQRLECYIKNYGKLGTLRRKYGSRETEQEQWRSKPKICSGILK